MEIALTYILIGVTVVTSLIAFSNIQVMNDLIFNTAAVSRKNQWWRFITSGFIHADYQHLAFNMFSFFLFGKVVEDAFAYFFKEKGKLLFVILYFTALVICLLPTYFKNRNNLNYRGLGASGAVSAMIFAGIFIDPGMGIGLIILPGIYIPGFIFGPLYLVGCVIMDRRKRDNINHSAHFWGAVYGIVFFIAAGFIFSDINPFTWFTSQMAAYFTKHF
ncbi:MAG TPA: rhomboid family intramembrane serine protease [Chitinophagaceae bacterium]|nr:rhomboid family intramembrane serine protease [Chitinophagaceae bacterium]